MLRPTAIVGRCLLALSLATSCWGCVTTGGQKIESQMETLEQERTPEKLVQRGKAFARVGDFTRAEQYLSAALDAGADPKFALPILLRVCVAEQRYRAAISYAEPQLKQKPEDFRLRFVLASLYTSIGESSVAWEHLTQVLTDAPDFAEAHFAIAMLSLKTDQDPVAADEHFREYLRLEPDGNHAAEAKSHLLRSMP
jgi:tetratricopeptide (TPR) repeat protein